MGRKRSNAPAYQFHVSGQARVTLAGKDYYLGPHGSDESYARYYALLAEYNAGNRRAPDRPTHQADDAITIRCVIADFRERVLPRYQSDEAAHTRFRNLCNLLDTRFGDHATDTFGPRKLESIRDSFIAKGNCRRYANEQTRNVIRIIRHGVSRELVPAPVLTALESLEPLRRGQARDNPKRGPVDLATVRATMEQLTPTLRTMVTIQLHTGCRPSELFSMTPAMVDRSGDCWMYRPDRHKTAHHGKQRAIPIVGPARESLTPFLFGDDICFRNSRGNPWDKDSYRHAIIRAAKRAKVKHWTPYAIRHLVAQMVRDAHGAEYVQAILGHSRLETSEVYSHVAESRAVEAAMCLQK